MKRLDVFPLPPGLSLTSFKSLLSGREQTGFILQGGSYDAGT